MQKTIINPHSLADPIGYANGIRTEGGRLLFLAGQIGMNKSGAKEQASALGTDADLPG